MDDEAQPALEGLGIVPARSRPGTRGAKSRTPAVQRPIARVVVDVQAPHLGRAFDYLVEERYSAIALPGVRVRVRFGGKLADGVIWERAESSTTQPALLKYVERVISPLVVLDDQMRRDVETVVSLFGGTRANVIRLAVPPRVARVEKTPVADSASPGPLLSDRAARYFDFEDRRVKQEYAGADQFASLLTASGWGQAVWDCLPGPAKWADDLAWALVGALRADRPVVACLPSHRAVGLVAERLRQYGLLLSGQDLAAGAAETVEAGAAETETVETEAAKTESADGGPAEALADRPVKGLVSRQPSQRVVIMDSTQSPEARYRSYVALCTGQASCVIGTRAAMYAPVRGPALFAVVDDNAYQNTDGFAPYATVRDVLQARAKNHQGVFLSLGWGRSPASEQEVDAEGSQVVELHGYPGALAAVRPWIRWLSPPELRALGDVTAGSRLPHTVTAALGKALRRGAGPVLVVVPYEGYSEVLACAQCHRQARCHRCSGPLRARGRALPVCAWCARSADGWTCQTCGGEQLRPVRVGAQGTADEVRGLFRDIPLVISTPNQPRGVVPFVPPEPRLVIATPGAQPQVSGGSYQALAILDAWTSLYSQALDARTDTLAVWMELASGVLPAAQGGEVLLVGQCDPDVASSLMAWDPRLLARRENIDRAEVGLPPSTVAASLWGAYPAVMDVLGEIGALDGDLASLGELPAVMGPIEIPPAPTVRNQQLEGVGDRVRAIVRVRPEQREELVDRLQRAVAGRAIRREPGEIRFWVNPKDLRER